jgi:hypothetical protein
MAKYRVLLHGRNVLMRTQEAGHARRVGFFVNCCVDASDRESAGMAALDMLRRHPNYARLASWPGGDSERPPIEVDSVDRVPWLGRRVTAGITTGFVFYAETDHPSKDNS